MKKSIKIFLIILSFLVAFTFCQIPITHAQINPDEYNPWEINPDGLDKDADTITKYTNNFGSVLTTIGIVISVIALMALGLKYIIGSAEEKAEYKKTLAPVIIGIILIACVLSVVKILQTFGASINNI